MTENINFRRIFLISLIASVAISALLGIGVILLGDFGYIEIRVLMTTFTITVMSICGLACGAYLEVERGRVLPKVGIGLSLIAALMALLVIWDVLDDYEQFIKSFVTATILAVASSHLSLLSLARLDQRFAWTRIVASVCIWAISAILIFIIWLEPAGDSDLIYRILGVLGILLASITVVTPVLHKLSNNRRTVQQIRDEIEELEAKIYHLNQERMRLQNLEADD
jgi:hypothetical protein